MEPVSTFCQHSGSQFRESLFFSGGDEEMTETTVLLPNEALREIYARADADDAAEWEAGEVWLDYLDEISGANGPLLERFFEAA